MILAQWTGAWGMHSDEERAVNARQIRTISFAHYKITVQNIQYAIYIYHSKKRYTPKM